MKLLKLSLLLVLITFLSACSDDDDPACTQADWVGNYTGAQVCNGASFDVTVSITASGSDAVLVIYEVDGLETEFDPLTFNNCDIDRTESTGDLTLTVDASLDGDNLTFRDVLTVGTETIDCSITATRN